MIIGTWNRTVKGGSNENGALEVNEWSITILRADVKLPDQWLHEASGSPAEQGLIFEFFWLPIDETLAHNLDPIFTETAKMIVSYVNH